MKLMEEPLIFVNIGWMVAYKGPTNDPTIGGHGWLKSHNFGYEAWNFLPYRNKLYGYVPRSARINLRSLGATKKNEKLTGVTVVWIARNPRNKVTYIVGWYRNATVRRESNYFNIKRSSDLIVDYQIEAPSSDARLLKPDQRTLKVPTAKMIGNLGQSPVWYGNPEFVTKVWVYLKSDGVKEGSQKGKVVGTPKQTDPEKRKLVELAAIRHAVDYYTSRAGGSYSVNSVEKDNIGWDLIVTGGDVTLKIEVKGLSGNELNIELTPNEYKQMISSEHRSMYVIYVVTEALKTTARSHAFYYNAEASYRGKHVWMTEDGRVLNIEERIGARLTVK